MRPPTRCPLSTSPPGGAARTHPHALNVESPSGAAAESRGSTTESGGTDEAEQLIPPLGLDTCPRTRREGDGAEARNDSRSGDFGTADGGRVRGIIGETDRPPLFGGDRARGADERSGKIRSSRWGVEI